MTFAPHLRLSFSGTIGTSGEIFSCSLSMVPNNSAWLELVNAVAMEGYLTQHLVSAAGADDWVDVQADVVDFWNDPFNRISHRARLKRIKLAPIGADGHYTGAALEAAYDIAGPQGVDPHPNQIARKVTFETDADLGRVKGGFYLPCQTGQDWDFDTNLWSATNTSGVRDAVQSFLNALNNDPGVDDHAFRVCVASQGRHNANGSVRMPPGNPWVERVNVGRRADVIRRRANKLSEARIADADIS